MSHFTPDGRARIVDVSAKPATVRIATAAGQIHMNEAASERVRSGNAGDPESPGKGDVLAVAQLAAISATKWTDRLIPLCHSIPIEAVDVRFDWIDPQTLSCHVTVRTTGKTGVEMEAMTGASVACLTVYDMLKSVDREMTIGSVQLTHKSGGKSGEFRREG